MLSPPNPTRLGRDRLLLTAFLVGVWLLAAVRLVLLPESVLTANLVVDDALYYALPARHWWQGHGYSFDGLEPTNGVQALWAAVTLGLAGVIADPLTLLRAMVAVSALCWGLAAVGLFALLRRRSLPAALLAAAGLGWSGVHERFAFMGMDNGLQALVAVLVLSVGARVVARGWTRPRAMVLGLALASMALARTEGALLGPVVGAALVFGWLGHAPAGERLCWRERLRLALVMALPGVVLVGALMLFYRVEFGLWLPISGSVKQFYETQWGGTDKHGGVLPTLAWHVRHVAYLALAPWREDLPTALGKLTGTGYRPWRNLMWAMLVIAAVAFVRGRRAPVSRQLLVEHRFTACFAVYALLHLIVIALGLPHFTDYATWYFASEVVVVWLGVGLMFVNLRGRWRLLPLLLAAALTVAGWLQAGDIAANVSSNRLRSAGEWLERNAPKSSVVGTFSSGLVGYYAPSQHVVNLDGLINNRRYLEDFLRPGRLGDYFDDKAITWFADYQALTQWRSGISWGGNIPPQRLVPRRYWRIANQHAYVVWQVLPRGQSFELLGERAVGDVLRRDRHAELAVAADVFERFPVVAHAELQEALTAHHDHVVARSMLEEPGSTLLHVLVPRGELEGLGMTPDTVWPEQLVDGEPVVGVEVLGYDATIGRQRGRPFVAVTLYWHRREPMHGEEPRLQLVLPSHPAGRRAAVPVGNCHGTLPIGQWPLDRVVAETVVFEHAELGEGPLVIERTVPPLQRLPLRRRDVGR